ncbi:MAG: hypothetical protein ISS78_01555 [Phycisphaerae bacterium]|nr:hypothetical protein [Phycisphaerae bacterium]
MKTFKSSAAIVVLAIVTWPYVGAVPGQNPKGEKPTPPAKAQKAKKPPTLPVDPKIRGQFYHICRTYNVTDQRKPKLQKLLLGHLKATESWKMKNEPKIKELRKKLAELRKRSDKLNAEIKKTEAAGRAMAANQNKQILALFSPDNILEARAVELLRRTVSYWQKLDDKMKAKVLQAARKAAAKAAKAKGEDERKAAAEAVKEMRAAAEQIVTARARQNIEIDGITASMSGPYRRLKLTDSQKSKIRSLCEKACRDRWAAEAERDKLQKKVDELRREQDWRKAYEAIKKTIADKILTPEQREMLTPRPKGRS